jgi:hypothetical protein
MKPVANKAADLSSSMPFGTRVFPKHGVLLDHHWGRCFKTHTSFNDNGISHMYIPANAKGPGNFLHCLDGLDG